LILQAAQCAAQTVELIAELVVLLELVFDLLDTRRDH
jgi:hypothetical protein